MSSKRKTLFLFRADELKFIRTLLEDLLDEKPIEKPIQYYYGVPRVGKTSLLHKIKNLAIDELGVPTASIDFDPEKRIFEKPIQDRYQGEAAIFNLIFDLSKQLKITSSQSFDPADSEKVIRDFLDNLGSTQKLSRKPLMLLFDTLEDVDATIFKRFQNSVLVPLLENRNILVIFAARAQIGELPISFDWPLRRQLKTHQLRPFSLDESDEHVKKLSEELGKPISKSRDLFYSTNGIPGLNEYVMYNPNNGSGNHLKRIVEDVILERAPEAEKNVLTTIAVCRLFDTELLAYLVENLGLPVFDEKGQTSGTNLLLRLLDTTLVEQRSDGTGYMVVGDIRRLVYDYLREVNSLRVLKTHELARQWFEVEVIKGDIVLLVELIYHQAGIWFNQSTFKTDSLGVFTPEKIENNDRLQRLKQIFNKYVETLKGNPRAPMLTKKIKEQLSDDEFKWFLTQKEVDSLVEVCDSFQESKSYRI